MTHDTPQSASASLSEGIELLIDLAQRGEIDPWDVQVIDVIDRHLSKLTPGQEKTPDTPFTELSQSGQAFLYAAMLVLLKSDSLAALGTEPETAEFNPEALINDDENTPAYLRPQNLERQLRRRAVAKIPQKRRVSLNELIDQMKLMADVIANHKSRPRRPRNRIKNRDAARAIAQLAHQENLTEMADKLNDLLSQSNVSLTQEWLDLDQLLQMWSQATESEQQTSDATEMPQIHHSPKSKRVGVFWGLLLLSAQSKVELVQEEFYQEIKIRSITPGMAEDKPEIS